MPGGGGGVAPRGVPLSRSGQWRGEVSRYLRWIASGFLRGESICRGYGRGEYPAHIVRPNRCVNRECDQFLGRVQPTAIGSPPDSFRLREMASVPDSASIPSAERERGIENTDELRRLKNARNRKFESISLQRRVGDEPCFMNIGEQ